MTRASELQKQLERSREHSDDLQARLNRYYGQDNDANERLNTLLDDILTLEPHLKHHQTDGSWDFDRVHRAAEHLRNIDAAASVGYTDHSPDNVTYLHVVHTTDPAA